jgi:hypothetical protein
MKKSKLFLLGTLITGMAFGLVLAGCSTTGNNGPMAEELAAQLAENINEIRTGSAEVDGATVTLTGSFVQIASDLTVPEGVTLDVTADNAALGLLDATLTVNGTVNANSNRVRLEDNASWGAINGSGTIQLKDKGSLLEVRGNRKLTLDGVTLVGVEDNDNSLIGINEGGEFVMKSGAITGNTRTSDGWAYGGGVAVWKGTFTMEGGTISGNTTSGKQGNRGGGVRIRESVFTMTGGTITGNSSKGDIEGGNQGGGVSLESGSTFIMKGGEISGNTTNDGGGVRIRDDCTFTMEGGAITGNSGERGGGVSLLTNGTFTMKGGEISGNTAERRGGGVYMENSTFTMEGGAISGNTAQVITSYGGGGGVFIGNSPYNSGGTFTLKGGRIQGSEDSGGFTRNISESGKSHALFLDMGTAKWGTGGTYTKGGESQSGGSDIGSTDDTLIAVPAN